MPQTDFGALTGAKKKIWSEITWRAGLDESFWFSSGMVGSGGQDSSKPIHFVKELTETERGDRCVMQLVAELQGDGIAGDNDIDGQEEPLINDLQEITIDQLSNAVKNTGRMSEQRTVLRFRFQARQKLTYWLGDKLDEMGFLTMSGRSYSLKLDGSSRAAGSALPQLQFAADVTAPSTNRITHAGAATSEGSITAGDTMTWNLITKLKSIAQRKRLKPMKMNGKTYYAVVMSGEQERDLTSSADYKAVLAQAGERGEKNPLFKGTFAVISGIMLFSHAKVYNTLGTATKWGAGNLIDGAQALFFGAQALGFARIGEPRFDESDQTNYGRRKGLSYGEIIGFKKPVWRSGYDNNASEDFGVVAVKTAAAAN